MSEIKFVAPNGVGTDAKLTVDGRDDMEITAVTIRAAVGELVEAEVSLWATTYFEATGKVLLTEGTREFLISIGWTPPASEEASK